MAKGRKYSSKYSGKYSSETPGIARRYLQGGDVTDADLACLLGISPTTLYNWKLKHPEFREAITAERDIQGVSQVQDALLKRAKGYYWWEHHFSYDREGKNPKKQKSVLRHVPASETLIPYYLSTRSPRRWPSRKAMESESQQDLTVNLITYAETKARRLRSQATANTPSDRLYRPLEADASVEPTETPSEGEAVPEKKAVLRRPPSGSITDSPSGVEDTLLEEGGVDPDA